MRKNVTNIVTKKHAPSNVLDANLVSCINLFFGEQTLQDAIAETHTKQMT
jgi:hypothetical protein